MTLEYPRAIRKVIDRIEQTQMPAIGKAADMVVHALANRGVVYCHNIGHGIEGDWIHRAGGLAAVQKFTYALNVQAPVPECLKDRPRGEPFDAIRESARYALKAGNIRAGDVMVLSSVSGRNIEPVQLALTCRELGVFTIALTSMDYTARVNSLHPSGKRLFEAADVALDCCAPYGDGAVDLPGYEASLLPVSGIAMDFLGWMLWETVIRRMAQAGTPAAVYMSINREGGQDAHANTVRQYNERGY